MIARKSLLIVFNNVVGGILGFISLYFIASRMGADSVGILGFGLSFIGMFTFISNLGFDSAHNKRVSEGRDLGECMGVYIRIKLKLTAVMVMISLIAIFIYGYVFDNFHSEKETHVVFIFLVYYVLWSLSIIAITTFNGLRKQALAQVPSIAEFIVRSPLIIALALLGMDIVSVAMVYLVGITALLLLAWNFMRNIPISKPSQAMTKSYVEFATPMAIISFTSAFALYLDKVMISSLSDTTQVGLYYGAQRIVMFIITSSASLAILLFPTISRYHAEGRLMEIREMISSAERYLSMLIFPAVALLAALSGPIMSIFGGMFNSSAAGWSLIYLSFYGLFSVLNKPFSQVITGTGRTRLAVIISLSIIIINTLLNLLLIPGWDFMPEKVLGFWMISGAVGAAAATALADAVRFVMLRIEASKILGYRMRYLVMIKFLISAVISGSFVHILHHRILMPDSIFFIIPEMVLGLGCYLLILGLFGEFTRKDFSFFLDLIHPGKMKEYIHGEIKGKEESSGEK